ncbi:hypothetical protein KIN20_018226 [Parelaphostrongylus tenuis]|uniref:Uncharacterized protein n=1 Tax=Parelaphostrongylus tenuis TaxID=148309 RepID=A0AAD5QPC8_PARTN|nr:hypothetical protein KIN20_018226 [Parelaphostrongylus tenuis]
MSGKPHKYVHLQGNLFDSLFTQEGELMRRRLGLPMTCRSASSLSYSSGYQE